MVSTGNQRFNMNTGDATLSATRARNINKEHDASMSPLERAATFISDRVGTPGFFLLLALWTAGWILWNSYGPREMRFDRGMEFAVWIFVSNLIQILLMPLLLIAQNLQSRHDHLQAEHDYQLTVRSEQEIEVILGHLYTLSSDMSAVMARLGISREDVRKRDGVPDAVEEQFTQRQQELLDVMAQRLAQTHLNALEAARATTNAVNQQGEIKK